MNQQVEPQTTEYVSHGFMSKLWHFLKPDLRKIIIFLILIIPIVYQIAHQIMGYDIGIQIPLKFTVLLLYLTASPSTLAIFPVFVILAGWNGPGILTGGLEKYLLHITIAILILPQWIFSCFISWLWKKIFSCFKTKALLVEMFVNGIIFLTFFIVAILIPLYSNPNPLTIDVEKGEITKSVLMTNGTLYVDGVFSMQQTKIKCNTSFYDLFSFTDFRAEELQLTGLTVCKCNTDDNTRKCDFQRGHYGGMRGVQGVSSYIRCGITEPREQFVNFYTNLGTHLDDTYDELYVFDHVGLNNEDFCSTLSDEDIKQGHEVKIIRQ